MRPVDKSLLRPPGCDAEGPFVALPCCPTQFIDRRGTPNPAVCNERGFWHHPDCTEPVDG